MKPSFLVEDFAIKPFTKPTIWKKPARNWREPAGPIKMTQANPAHVIRRVLVASITGSLPDDCRDEAIVLLTQALNAPDDEVRALAVLALNEVGGDAAAILPPMIDALADSNEMVRKRAARVMAEFGASASPALPHLNAGLNDGSLAVRLECAAALGRIGPEAEPALPNLFALLLEPDMRVRTIISSTIRRIGQTAIGYALAMLLDDEALLRERSCDLLGRMGCLDDSVVEALLEACADSEPEVRAAARHALERLQQRG